ncbi:MAG: SEL1-like repeat protein [Candidatus Riflebacteria bacterium]|nr:SEL1-like repeat protein [Candidatus Riflebacteria bacterium]
MKHLEKLAEALHELTDRYGITMTEVPDRLREKILQKVGSECASDLDVILAPLLNNSLRPLRIRAGHRVDKSVVAEVIKNTAELEGFDFGLAETIVKIWMSVFAVREGESLVVPVEKHDHKMEPPTVSDHHSMPAVDHTVKKTHAKAHGAGHYATSGTEDKPDRGFGGRHYDHSETDKNSVRGGGSSHYDVDEKSIKPAHKSADAFSSLSFDNKKEQDQRDASRVERPTSARGESSRSEKHVKKHVEKLTDLETTPLQPDMVSFSGKSTLPDSASAKHSIEDAFRNLRNGEYQVASKIMMELARAGDTKAQFHLGEFYLMGTGVEQSNDKAKYWFRKAAAHGSVPAKTKLEDLEAPESQGGCLGCAFSVFLVFVVIKFLASVLS